MIGHSATFPRPTLITGLPHSFYLPYLTGQWAFKSVSQAKSITNTVLENTLPFRTGSLFLFLLYYTLVSTTKQHWFINFLSPSNILSLMQYQYCSEYRKKGRSTIKQVLPVNLILPAWSYWSQTIDFIKENNWWAHLIGLGSKSSDCMLSWKTSNI